MGRLLKFVLSLLVTGALFWVYQHKTGDIPPIGKFFSPAQGFWHNAEKQNSITYSAAQLKDLKSSVTVQFDDRLVPHIFAKNEEDLYFMQGYITAQHRLWQMDMQTRVASGRLSEIIGPKLLERDRESRRLGLSWGASRSHALMMANPDSRRVITSYCNGVNAWIKSLKPADYPLEYKLLDFEPEAWTTMKSALLLKYMANMLTGYETDFEMTNIAKLYGIETLNQLFPEFPDSLDPVIPKGSLFSQSDTLLPVSPDTTYPGKFALLHNPYSRPDPAYGSNNWAISGSKSASGKPILCNDPHLGLNLPSIWYEVQLNAPGINTYGATIPGSPCVISGFNEKVAWGITNASTDVKDWYTVTFKDKSKSQYLMDSAWKPVRKLIEVFRVRGGGLVFDTIRFTEHGPVAYEESFNKRSETVNMALRWTAHDISNEMLAIYQLNKAENHADYIAATNHFDCPGQNFVFAATNGDIAIRHNGKFVKRWNQQGRFLLDGTSSSTLWQGFVPDSDNPHVLNPPQGFVSSANQHPTDQTYPYYYTGSYDYYRNRRLNRLLKDLREAKPADMMKIQNDNYNLYASEWLPYFVALMPETQFSTSEKDAMRELKGWTFFNDPDVSAAIYFQLWIDSFMSKLWDEFKVDQRALLTPSYFETWSYLKRFPESDFIDNKSTTQTETLPFLILQSFREAVKTADKWQLENPTKQFTWANYKNTTVLHLSQQLAFSVSEIQTGGNEDILNATSSRKGASWRMVVSPGSDGEFWGVYPGGQSGNPGSKHYVDFIEQWAKGKYFQLLFLQPGEKHKRIQHVATYNP